MPAPKEEEESAAAVAAVAAWQDHLPQRADLEKALSSSEYGTMQEIELGKTPVLSLKIMIAPPLMDFFKALDNDDEALHEAIETAFIDSDIVCAPDLVSDAQREVLEEEDADVAIYEAPEAGTDLVINALAQLEAVTAREETGGAVIVFIPLSAKERAKKSISRRQRAQAGQTQSRRSESGGRTRRHQGGSRGRSSVDTFACRRHRARRIVSH